MNLGGADSLVRACLRPALSVTKVPASWHRWTPTPHVFVRLYK